MLTRIQALHFRSLRFVDQSLDAFHVLVGPNASGKTTFLDAINFLGDLVAKGLDEAVNRRTHNFQDLVWERQGQSFELALEARIPQEQKEKLPTEHRGFDTIRYEVGLALDKEANQVAIIAERIFLQKGTRPKLESDETPTTILLSREEQLDENHLIVAHKQNLSILRKVGGASELKQGFDNIQSETFPFGDDAAINGERRQSFPFSLGARQSTLASIPNDEFFFPVTTWFKKLLTEGLQMLILNSLALRAASAPGQGLGFKADGSNLPWVVDNLRKKSRQKFRDWIAHLQTALPDLENVRVVRRDDDGHLYLMVRYRSGVEVPSWMVSDGTLRLMALTLSAYLPDFHGVFLIEEPENGIHPRAVETLFQSLSSAYNAQLLLATHSPIVLSIVEARQVLCFSKNEEGATQIVEGDQHPALQNWQGETDLGTLFAAGVLS